MNRSYELGFIIPSNVSEQDTQVVINTVKEFVEGHEGSVTNVDFWGRRRLAYPIEDFREGYYIFLQMEYPTQHLPELERTMRLNDKIIRHLVVRLDE